MTFIPYLLSTPRRKITRGGNGDRREAGLKSNTRVDLLEPLAEDLARSLGAVVEEEERLPARPALTCIAVLVERVRRAIVLHRRSRSPGPRPPRFWSKFSEEANVGLALERPPTVPWPFVTQAVPLKAREKTCWWAEVAFSKTVQGTFGAPAVVAPPTASSAPASLFGLILAALSVSTRASRLRNAPSAGAARAATNAVVARASRTPRMTMPLPTDEAAHPDLPFSSFLLERGPRSRTNLGRS
jgi:hypothetical protein